MLEFDTDTTSESEIKRWTVAALVYDEQAYPDRVLKHIVDHCRMGGMRLAASSSTAPERRTIAATWCSKI
jgi:hypothetical protein